jgi:hypothetical protein
MQNISNVWNKNGRKSECGNGKSTTSRLWRTTSFSKDEGTVQDSEGPMGDIAIDNGDAEDEALGLHAYGCDDYDDGGGYVGDDGNPYYLSRPFLASIFFSPYPTY